MTNKIERVAAYIRVSTQEQKLHGISLDAQKDKLTDYANKHNLKIVDWYMDEGVSGRKLIRNRPELQRMIIDAEAGKFDRIIFIKLDRFFRSVAEYHECMKRIDPVVWTATEEKYDLSTANGKAFVNMKLTIAELEADQTGERIRLVNEYKVKTGQPLTGSSPFCFMIKKTENGKRFVKNPETAPIMEDALAHIMQHQSVRKTMQYINNKYDMAFTYQPFRLMFKNTLLYGEFRGNPNYLAPEDCFMTKEEWLRMQEVLKRQVKVNSPNRDYLFTGLLICPCCGKLLKGTPRKEKKASGKVHEYKLYKCSKAKIDCSCNFKKTCSENQIELAMLENIEKYFAEAKIKDAEVSAGEAINPDGELKALQSELDRLNYSWQKGRIKEVEKYDREYDELTAKIEALQEKQIEVVQQDFSKVEEVLSGNWKEIYNALDDAHKRSFWRSFIKSIEISKDWPQQRIDKVNFF